MISFTVGIALRSTLLEYLTAELDQHKHLLSNLTTSLPQSPLRPSPLLTAAMILHYTLVFKHLKLAPYSTGLSYPRHRSKIEHMKNSNYIKWEKTKNKDDTIPPAATGMIPHILLLLLPFSFADKKKRVCRLGGGSGAGYDMKHYLEPLSSCKNC